VNATHGQPVPTMVSYTARFCVGCGKRSAVLGVSNPDRKYCTVACYRKSTNVQVTKHCPVCDTDYMVHRSTADRYTACSTACRTAETKYVDCERCGTRFRAEKHLNRHYCSEECRRPPVYAICPTCGETFRVFPSKANDEHNRFCGQRCYRLYRGETPLERKVRETLADLGIEVEQEYQIGRWLADFAIVDRKIAIEADGDYWHGGARDRRRDQSFADLGWQVIRLSETEIRANDYRKLQPLSNHAGMQ